MLPANDDGAGIWRTRLIIYIGLAAVLLLALGAGLVYFLQTTREKPPADLHEPRVIAMGDSVWLEELTWMEVRDSIANGKTTVIIPSGGIEMAGPFLATGKHNFLVRVGCEAIARKLGNALCAPVVPFGSRGNIKPPTRMMHYPGVISLTAKTYEALITEVVRSLIRNGFKNIILIADSGDKDPVLQAVEEKFSNGSKAGAASVYYIPEYKIVRTELKLWVADTLGWQEKSDGLHDDPRISVQLMAVNPDLVRIKEREAVGKASINGISLLPIDKAAEAGRRILDLRVNAAVAAIRNKQAASKSRRRLKF